MLFRLSFRACRFDKSISQVCSTPQIDFVLFKRYERRNSLYGYIVAQTIVQVLKQCGDDMSRENILKQATNVKAFHASGLLPGVTINTSPTNYHPLSQLQLMRFDKQWTSFGDVISAE